MRAVAYKTRSIRVCVASIALSITLGSLCLSLQGISARARKAPGTTHYSKRMADGKEWTTHNADAVTTPSYCYADQKVMRAVDGSTTLVEVARLSIVKAAAISSGHFLFGVLGINDSYCQVKHPMPGGILVGPTLK